MTDRYSDDIKTLISFNAVEGLGIRRKHRLTAAVEKLSDFLDLGGYAADVFVRIAGAELFSRFKDFVHKKGAEEVIEQLEKQSVRLIGFMDAEYPAQLLNIFEYPLLLYTKGEIDLLKKRIIAVVGTRKATRYGINVCRDFTMGLSAAGLVTVSGFARGIDTAAHKAAVEMEYPTISVWGSGLDIIYPAENRNLAQKIVETGGLILSEYPLGTHPNTFNFPERNRIISGLAEGVLVPETAQKGGTLITVNLALEQGKELFVVPGNVNSEASKGCNMLLKSMQGALVTEANDILDRLNIKCPKKERAQAVQLTIAEQHVIDALSGGELHFEQLLAQVDLSLGELSALLTEMEINDLIDKINGNFYSLK